MRNLGGVALGEHRHSRPAFGAHLVHGSVLVASPNQRKILSRLVVYVTRQLPDCLALDDEVLLTLP
jgi:hypothetical protein